MSVCHYARLCQQFPSFYKGPRKVDRLKHRLLLLIVLRLFESINTTWGRPAEFLWSGYWSPTSKFVCRSVGRSVGRWILLKFSKFQKGDSRVRILPGHNYAAAIPCILMKSCHYLSERFLRYSWFIISIFFPLIKWYSKLMSSFWWSQSFMITFSVLNSRLASKVCTVENLSFRPF